MKKFLLSCLFCGWILFSAAQTVRTPVAAVYTKLNTYSSSRSDAFSFKENQAALASLKSFSAGIYGERKFMLNDLALYQLALALPTTSGNFGIVAVYSGNSLFKESEIGLAYGRSLGKIDAGVQFNYYSARLSEYGNASAVNFEAGLLMHISEKFQSGIHIYNPVRRGFGKEEEKLPMVYSAGFGYDVSQSLFIGCEIEKEEHQPVNVQAGFEYAFDKKLFLRMGMASSPSLFYFGLGFLWNSIRIDASVSLHQQLGITPGILLVYNTPSKK